MPLDVRDDAAVVAVAAAVPRCDVLIHCAGRLVRHEEHQVETFKDALDIHLVGALRLANAFRDKLKVRPGCIINIGSMYSYFGTATLPAYASAKTAIVGLTRSQALACAADGIRANGKLVALPINIEGPLFYWRKDIFQKCGIAEPMAAEDLLPTAEKLKNCMAAHDMGMVTPWAARGAQPHLHAGGGTARPGPHRHDL
jgi:NAD(P)-dependent dehydrogenase (short-subunit alcohol dehydrogenase family)